MTSRRHLLRAGFAATLLQACGARAADDAAPLRFSDFYVGPTFEDGVGMRPELQLSPRVLALSGRRVEIVGFMDGILPRDGMYFMLIREPSFLCPFHTVSFDWAGFVPVFVEKPVEYVDGPIRVTGRLDTGKKTDEMSLISHVRIYGARIARVR